MTRLLCFPLLFAVACKTGGDDVDTDSDAITSDETDATSSDDEGTDDEGNEDDTDGGGDTDPEQSDSVAGAWSGTWSFTWQYTERDWDHPGPGELWEPRDSSCSSGTISLSVDEAGVITVSPAAACSAGSQINWTHANLIDASVSTDGSLAIEGMAMFGSIAQGGTFVGGMAVAVTGSISSGTMTISGARSQNQQQPTENLSFTASLTPAAVAAELP